MKLLDTPITTITDEPFQGMLDEVSDAIMMRKEDFKTVGDLLRFAVNQGRKTFTKNAFHKVLKSNVGEFSTASLIFHLCDELNGGSPFGPKTTVLSVIKQSPLLNFPSPETRRPAPTRNERKSLFVTDLVERRRKNGSYDSVDLG